MGSLESYKRGWITYNCRKLTLLNILAKSALTNLPDCAAVIYIRVCQVDTPEECLRVKTTALKTRAFCSRPTLNSVSSPRRKTFCPRLLNCDPDLRESQLQVHSPQRCETSVITRQFRRLNMATHFKTSLLHETCSFFLHRRSEVKAISHSYSLSFLSDRNSQNRRCQSFSSEAAIPCNFVDLFIYFFFSAVLHIWQGQASATVWGLLSLPSRNKTEGFSQTHRDNASIKRGHL